MLKWCGGTAVSRVTWLCRSSFLGGGMNFSLRHCVQTASGNKMDIWGYTRSDVAQVGLLTIRLNLAQRLISSGNHVHEPHFFNEFYFKHIDDLPLHSKHQLIMNNEFG
jgi:hypothetical protein